MGEPKKLRVLLAKHVELHDVAKNNATVYAWLKQCDMGRCTAEEALIGSTVWLARENKKYLDRVVQYSMLYGDLNGNAEIITVQCPKCPAFTRGYTSLEQHLREGH